MLKFTRDSNVDIEEYERLIRIRTEYGEDSAGNKRKLNNGFLYFDKDRCEIINKYNKVRIDSLYWYLHRTLDVRTGGYAFNSLRDGLIHHLTKDLYVNESLLRTKSTKGISISSKVLKLLIYKGYATDLLEDYLEYNSLKSKSSRLPEIFRKLKETNLLAEDGTKLYKLPYFISQAVNLRYNTSDVSVISIPKIYNSCITCPDDYILISADFAQSDFRIFISLFVIDENNYEYFLKYDDYYEAIARLMCELENEEFDYDKFFQERDLYKVYALETVYGTVDSLNSEEKKFIDRFVKFLNKCPRYNEYRRRLYLTQQLGLNAVVKDYFGHEEIVDLNSSTYESNKFNFCLNSPIQSATSSVLILTVVEIMKQFYSLGLTDDDIQFYFPRHDEGIFILKKSHMDKLYVFDNSSKILIDNFCPLVFDFKVYNRYKEPNDSLQNEFKFICDMNKDKIEHYERDNNFDFSYMPIKDIFEISLSTVRLPNTNKFVTCIYYDKLNTADYLLLEGSQSEINESITMKIAQCVSSYIDRNEYKGVIIKNSLIKDEHTFEKLFFKYVVQGNGNIIKANLLAHNMLWRYTEREGIDYEVPDHIAKNLKEIKGIKMQGIVK